MAKKSFNLYNSWDPIVETLDVESAGEILKAIYAYQNGRDYAFTNPALAGIMALFIAKFKEDEAAYEKACEKNRKNGVKGGRKTQNNPVGSFGEEPLKESEETGFSNPNKADTDTDTDTETDTDTGINNNTILSPKRGTRLSDKQLDEEFEELWTHYPRKDGKQQARKAYRKARRDGVSSADVLIGINRYKAYLQASGTEDQYIKMGSSFFNQRGWESEWRLPRSGTEKMIEEVDAWAARQSTTLPW